MRSLNYTDYRETRRFAALDGLRAVTVVSLVGLHYGFGDFNWLVGKGKITVFFVLSGFVITLLLLRDEEKHGRIRLRDFFIRRQFRLLPVFWVVVAVTVVCRYGIPQSGPGDGSWHELAQMLPYYLTFTHEWGPGGTDITTLVHSWTLAYEQKFYLAWPLAFWALTRWLPRWRLMGTIGLTAATLALIPIFDERFTQYFALMLGCVLALLCHERSAWRFVQPLTHPVVATGVALAFIPVHIYIGQLVRYPHDPVLVWYALAVAVLVIAVLHTGPTQWLLTRRPLLFIGERGYAMYLIHGLAGQAVIALTPHWAPGGLKRYAIIVLMTLIFADMLYRYVELPSAALGRRFIGWLNTRKAPAATEPAPLPPRRREPERRPPPRPAAVDTVH